MPLTPAEVHNIAFKKPPIGKRGYDEEEVDAFLDIVEIELSRLIEENNDLRSRSGGGKPVQATDDGGAVAAELAAARDETARMQSHIAELERTINQGKDGAQQQVVQLQQQLTQTEEQLAENRRQLERAEQAAVQAQRSVTQADEAAGQAAPPAGAPADQHTQAVAILVLAQQTADQLLGQSKAEAERLLAEAQTNAENELRAARETSEKNVGEAEARATHAVQEAEQRAASITAHFEQRKVALERRVEELGMFEREYRNRLKSYLESQLRDLDAGGDDSKVALSEAESAGANNDFAQA